MQGKEINILQAMLGGDNVLPAASLHISTYLLFFFVVNHKLSSSQPTVSNDLLLGTSSVAMLSHRQSKMPAVCQDVPSSLLVQSILSVSSMLPMPSPIPLPHSHHGMLSALHRISRASNATHAGAMSSSWLFHTNAVSSPQAACYDLDDNIKGSYNYRPHTNHVVAYHGLPEETFEVICTMQAQYALSSWMQGLLHHVPSIDKATTDDITDAMCQSWHINKE